MVKMPPVLVQPIKAIKHARKLRKEMSLPEVLLWVQLQKHPGSFNFRKQVPQDPYTLDFACLKARLAIEVDGAAHNLGDQPSKDEARDREIAERGFRTLRVPAHEVLQNMESVLIRIVEACSEANPPRHGEVAPPFSWGDGGVSSRKHGANREQPLRPLEGAPPRSGEDFRSGLARAGEDYA